MQVRQNGTPDSDEDYKYLIELREGHSTNNPGTGDVLHGTLLASSLETLPNFESDELTVVFETPHSILAS